MLALPGATIALRELWARRGVAGHHTRSRTELELSVRFSIRRGRGDLSARPGPVLARFVSCGRRTGALRRAGGRGYRHRRVSELFPIAVLVSGTGTNLQALLDTVHGREARVVAVASSGAGAPALARAEQRGVPTAVFARAAYPDRVTRDEALADWLAERGARLVVLAGYMELLGEPFLSRFPDAVINVHPSLLPAFPGLAAIEQALAYGVKVFGVTVHFVDAGVDSGAVILQRAVELPHARDPDEVLAALRPLEHELLALAVALFARGALRADPDNPRRTLVDRGAVGGAAGAAGVVSDAGEAIRAGEG
jgi:phosphoribosylglycinamide formyltransferase 1